MTIIPSGIEAWGGGWGGRSVLGLSTPLASIDTRYCARAAKWKQRALPHRRIIVEGPRVALTLNAAPARGGCFSLIVERAARVDAADGGGGGAAPFAGPAGTTNLRREALTTGSNGRLTQPFRH